VYPIIVALFYASLQVSALAFKNFANFSRLNERQPGGPVLDLPTVEGWKLWKAAGVHSNFVDNGLTTTVIRQRHK